MNNQPRKPSVLPGRVVSGAVTRLSITATSRGCVHTYLCGFRMEGHKISLSGRCRRRMEGVGASEGNGVIFTENAVMGVCLNLSWCLEALFPRGAFYLRRRSRSIVSNRLGSRCRSKRSPRLARVQESGGTSREARGGVGLALKRSTMIDAIANRNAASRVTAIRDHIPTSQALLGAVDYAPLAHG
jgi:hypothetical protein